MKNQGHLTDQIRNKGLRSDNTLHVIGVISNPARYNSRYRLYRQWLAAISDNPCVKVYTVEAVLNDRHFEVTDSDNPMHLQIEVPDGIWIKENMINLGVRYLLPRDWKYVAWVDCDVFFRDRNWAQETLQQLQHYEIVQPWSECLDLGFDGEVLNHFKSFGYYIHNDIKIQKWCKDPYPYGHSGFAWAATREFWEQTRGLLDVAILGSGDHHMAWSVIGEIDSTIHAKMSDGFKAQCKEWQRVAVRASNKQVGFTQGRIEHHFHGKKKNRYYRERWQILIDSKYDPMTDLKYGDMGQIELIGKPDLANEIHKYNLSRQEDSIDSA